MSSSQLTRVKILRNPDYVHNGTKSYVYTLQKYGITPTKAGRYHRNRENVLMKKAGDETAHVVTAADIQNDSMYTCQVQIGTPPQTLDLDFDSGSSDLWFWSTEIVQNVQRIGKAAGVSIFDPAKSNTFKKTPDSSFEVHFGDNSWAKGDVGTDVVKIGDISIKNQAVELANYVSSQFQRGGSSGLLGLAFGQLNSVKPRGVKLPLENMIAQEDIPADQELFTCYLGSVKDVDDPDKGKSFYTFGSIDQSVVRASGQDISYTPVDSSQGFWMFASEVVTVGGQTINRAGNKAIADTGTTLLITSDEVCEAIYGAIPGAKYDASQQGWTFPANTAPENLPEVAFAVGDKTFKIEKEHLGWAPTDDAGQTLYGGIQSRGNLDFDIFGDTFLKCIYAIFDAAKPQFGAVQRADPTPNGTSN